MEALNLNFLNSFSTKKSELTEIRLYIQVEIKSFSVLKT